MPQPKGFDIQNTDTLLSSIPPFAYKNIHSKSLTFSVKVNCIHFKSGVEEPRYTLKSSMVD